MKRLLSCAGVALLISFFSSCAQSDTKSPDTSGNAPYGSGQPNAVGIDTITEGTRMSPNGGNNNSDSFPGMRHDGNATPGDRSGGRQQ